jgi:hypothetical protein
MESSVDIVLAVIDMSDAVSESEQDVNGDLWSRVVRLLHHGSMVFGVSEASAIAAAF